MAWQQRFQQFVARRNGREAFIEFRLESLADVSVREICDYVTDLALNEPETPVQSMTGLCEFMLEFSFDSDPEIVLSSFCALEALSDLIESKHIFISLFPILLPRIVECMKLTIEQHEREVACYNTDAGNSSLLGYKPLHQVEDQDEDQEDDTESQWTLRKQACSFLEAISQNFEGPEVLSHCLPLLESKLLNENEWEKELGLLGFGVLAAQFAEHMSSTTFRLFPFFVQVGFGLLCVESSSFPSL